MELYVAPAVERLDPKPLDVETNDLKRVEVNSLHQRDPPRLHPPHEVERAIDLARQHFVSEVGIDHDVFLRGDLVVRREL